eukprot:scaffold242264_cov18-Tisochrysis_lutea.AAC.1
MKPDCILSSGDGADDWGHQALPPLEDLTRTEVCTLCVKVGLVLMLGAMVSSSIARGSLPFYSPLWQYKCAASQGSSWFFPKYWTAKLLGSHPLMWYPGLAVCFLVEVGECQSILSCGSQARLFVLGCGDSWVRVHPLMWQPGSVACAWSWRQLGVGLSSHVVVNACVGGCGSSHVTGCVCLVVEAGGCGSILSCGS